MAISGVNPKCYILALFVRDDGARFLLGEDPFEFKDNQLHFQQNTMANDVVEVQGNDGYLLAGQVRRPGTQMFDGYVCNGTNSKEEVEVKRRSFLQFFRRSHFYKVIYVFPNGTAIQRKQGFLVDDPTVQELYQQYPEYHVALNFEDVNYYTYEEDDQGHEIYAKEAIVPLARGGAMGGLIWDSYGVVWEDPWSLPLSISGVQFQILNNAGARAPIDNVELYGDTYQQTYSGKNVFNENDLTFDRANVSADQIQLSALSTGIRFNTTYISTTGSPSITFNTGIDLTPLAGKTIRLKANFGEKGEARIMRLDNDLHSAETQTLTVSGDTISWVVPNDLGSSKWLGYGFRIVYPSNEIHTVDFTNVCITIDNADMNYEPYTGGPAPNPDYPQDIQVVTGEQTIKTNGKNLLTGDYAAGTHLGVEHSWDNVFVKVYGTTTASYADLVTNSIGSILPPGTYRFSISKPISQFRVNFRVQYGGSNHDAVIMPGNTYATLTIPDNVNDAIIQRPFISGMTTGTFVSDTFGLMLEEGSTATPFQRYYTQSHTIDLGSTELCKIGTYQDYIYNSGEDWYVHKETNKLIANSSQEWTYNEGTAPTNTRFGCVVNDAALEEYTASQPSIVMSNCFRGTTWYNLYRSIAGDNVVSLKENAHRIYVHMSSLTTIDAWNTFITNNTVLFRYVLATPTDTKITDATLLGQLEALGAMKLFIGENNVLVSATSPNLPATLAFDYYTKFTAIGAEWEEGGTKGATIVNVDAIDNTYPVWELTGPATNPTLSVLTTNTTLTYNGTITASQKLVIDMFNKTATLNGTSVIGNISGDFVYMAPGTNRVTYTAGNTDAPDSTIYWQEVVG